MCASFLDNEILRRGFTKSYFKGDHNKELLETLDKQGNKDNYLKLIKETDAFLDTEIGYTKMSADTVKPVLKTQHLLLDMLEAKLEKVTDNKQLEKYLTALDWWKNKLFTHSMIKQARNGSIWKRVGALLNKAELAKFEQRIDDMQKSLKARLAKK